MRVRISHSANRLLWVGAFAGLLVTSAAATSGVSATGDSARAPVDKVCGGTLTADATFDDESAELGTQHACEHLAARKEVETRADRVAARATYREAVSDLPTARPAQVGKWSAAQNPGTKTDGVSAVLLHTGKVLLVGSSYTEGVKPPAYIFNPRTGNGHAVKAPAPIFCHSIVQLSDGRVLSVGGSNPNPQGIPDVWLFRSPSGGSASPMATPGAVTTRRRPGWPTAPSSPRQAPRATERRRTPPSSSTHRLGAATRERSRSSATTTRPRSTRTRS